MLREVRFRGGRAAILNAVLRLRREPRCNPAVNSLGDFGGLTFKISYHSLKAFGGFGEPGRFPAPKLTDFYRPACQLKNSRLGRRGGRASERERERGERERRETPGYEPWGGSSVEAAPLMAWRGELGTYKPVKARFWLWLDPVSIPTS